MPADMTWYTGRWRGELEMSRGTVWCRWPLLSPRNTLHLSSHNNCRDKCSSLFVSTLRLLSSLLTICGPEAIRTIPTFTGGYLTQLSFQLGRVSHLLSICQLFVWSSRSDWDHLGGSQYNNLPTSQGAIYWSNPGFSTNFLHCKVPTNDHDIDGPEDVGPELFIMLKYSSVLMSPLQ